MRTFDSIGEWINLSLHDGWRWILSLNTQEWFLLLGITAAAGFCCMRGFGSRNSY
jgi:hypothetical protein